MTRSNTLLALVWLAIGVCVALGCSSTTDPWRESYQPSKHPPRHGVKTAPQLRIVSMDQIQRGTEAGRKYLDDRKLAIEDATPADLTELRRLSLAELRWPIDPASVRVLGVCAFDAPASEATSVDSLVRFGSSVGADYIVTASASAGTRSGTYSRPVISTTNARASATAYDNRGNWAKARGTGQSSTTTWVPQSYEYEVHNFFALFYVNVQSESSLPAPRTDK